MNLEKNYGRSILKRALKRQGILERMRIKFMSDLSLFGFEDYDDSVWDIY